MFFFDKIAYHIFSISEVIHRLIFGIEDYRDSARLQMAFIVSFLQCVIVFFIIVDSILFLVWQVHTPKFVIITGFVVLLILNLWRYKINVLQEIGAKKPLFINNLGSNAVMFLYFMIVFIIAYKIGDWISIGNATR